MAYDMQETIVNGVYKPTDNWGGPHCIYLFCLGCQPLATWDEQVEKVAAILHSHPSCPIQLPPARGPGQRVCRRNLKKKCGNNIVIKT